jgi:hypothetical protein
MSKADKTHSMQLAKQLNKRYMFSNDRIMTLGQWIDSQAEMRLNVAGKYYWANDMRVSKLVFDHLQNILETAAN